MSFMGIDAYKDDVWNQLEGRREKKKLDAETWRVAMLLRQTAERIEASANRNEAPEFLQQDVMFAVECLKKLSKEDIQCFPRRR